MPKTLYVVVVPAGSPRDLTLRSRRILAEVETVAACELTWARHFLEHLDLQPNLIDASAQADVWAALQRGDVALLSGGERAAPCKTGLALLEAALNLGISVVPIPGPVLPVTALVVSGLPADSFVFLGELPQEMAARHRLLDSVASEHRTLIVVEASDRLAGSLTDLLSAFGDRPLVAVIAAEPQPGWIWRGTLAAAAEQGVSGLLQGKCALVVGGSSTEEPAWDEGRLRAEVNALKEAGLRSKEIASQLSDRSGWSRREIYRMAVEQVRSPERDRPRA